MLGPLRMHFPGVARVVAQDLRERESDSLFDEADSRTAKGVSDLFSLIHLGIRSRGQDPDLIPFGKTQLGCARLNHGYQFTGIGFDC